MFIDRFFKRGRHNPDDTRFKSLLKTISWWVLAPTDTLMIARLLTGNLKTVGSIMSLEIFTKMFLYYVHERFWILTRTNQRFSAWRLPRNSKLFWPTYLAGMRNYNDSTESGYIGGASAQLGGPTIAR